MFVSKKAKFTFATLLILVLTGASINIYKSLQHNTQKLPAGLESEHKFEKWINRWKERFPQIGGDSFKMVDDGEVISSANPRYIITEKNADLITAEIAKVINNKYVVIAPDKFQYLNFREYFTPTKEATSSYVYYYGARENRTIAGPIYECKKTVCYYDRPFFITPTLFYLAEVKEQVDEKDPFRCQTSGICVYELYLHEFDLAKNKRTTFLCSELLTDLKKIQDVVNDL